MRIVYPGLKDFVFSYSRVTDVYSLAECLPDLYLKYGFIHKACISYLADKNIT